MPQRQERPLLVGFEQPVKIPQQQVIPSSPASSGAVSAVASDVSALDARVTTNEGDISTLDTAVAANSAFIAQFSSLGDYADDTAAAAGGVAVGELYRNGSALMIRVA